MPSLSFTPNTSSLTEVDGSPEYSLGEVPRIIVTFEGQFNSCVSAALTTYHYHAAMPGYNGFRIIDTNVTRSMGKGTLRITAEAYTADSGVTLPDIEDDTSQEQLERPIEEHPYFKDNLNEAEIKAVNDFINAPTPEAAQNNAWVATSGGYVQELYENKRRGNTHYLLWVPTYSYSVASWSIPTISEGGFIDIPDGPGASALPDLVWLRKADIRFNRNGYWTLTKSWIGAPDWDTHLYTPVV
jgi:hypothetical protein